jgi:exopolysaccharide production protein ExoQ
MTTTDQNADATERLFYIIGTKRGLSHVQLLHLLLAITSYIALFRSTSMGYGYPSYQDQLGEADYGMLAVLNYCLAGLGAIYILLDGAFLLQTAMRAPIMIFGLFLLAITIIASEDPVYSARSFMTVFFITLPIVAFTSRFRIDRTLDLVRRFCVAAILANLLYAAAFPQFAIMGGDAGFRGMFAHKNVFGPFMAISFVILLPSWKRLDVNSFIALAACVIAFAFVLLSRSASAWTMLLAAPILYFGLRLILFSRSRATRLLATAASVIIAVAVIGVGYAYLSDAFLTALGRDATLTGRTKMWAVLIDVTWETPYLGHGFGIFSRPSEFMQFWQEFGWNAGSTHNSYLETLLNIGYGVSAFWAVLLLGNAWKNLVSHRGNWSTNLVKQQIVTVMVLLSAFSQASHFFSGTFFWLALVISLFKDTRILPLPNQNINHRRRPLQSQVQHPNASAIP